jgi:hypothetical protein
VFFANENDRVGRVIFLPAILQRRDNDYKV